MTNWPPLAVTTASSPPGLASKLDSSPINRSLMNQVADEARSPMMCLMTPMIPPCR